MNKTIHTRNHVSYILEQLGTALIAIGLLILGQGELLTEGIEFLRQGKILEALIAMGAILVIIAVVVGFSAWRWYRTFITVADGTLTIEQNTMNKKKDTIAVQNISNINLEQNLFEMIMGTYKLKLDIDSLSTADKTDVKIVLKREDAYAMKDLIMTMIKEAKGEEAQEEANDFMDDRQESDYDVTYTGKEIVKNCIMNTSIFAILICVGLFISCFVIAGELLSEGEAIGGVIVGFLMQFLVAGSVLWALIKSWLADYRFRAKREKDKVYVRCGVLKIRKYAVPVEKINAICIRSTFLGRLCKHAYVKVINVGGEDEDVDGMKLMLFEPIAKLGEHLKVLLPEIEIPKFTMTKQPTRVLVRNLIVATLVMGCAAGGFTAGLVMTAERYPMWWIYAILAGIYAFVVLCVVLTYGTAGIAVLEHYVVIRSGTFGKTIEIIPYEKIQYINTKSGLIDRWLHLRRGSIAILASTASQNQSFVRFPEEQIDELVEKFRETY